MRAKDQGNLLYKEGKLEESLGLYTASIGHLPTSVVRAALCVRLHALPGFPAGPHHRLPACYCHYQGSN